MVPYFGMHSAKIFNRGKLIRFGYKNWVLASSDGYPYIFETYTGACDTKNSSKPLGPLVVSALSVETLLVIVYFDNFFTSHYLLRDLHKNCRYRDADSGCVDAPYLDSLKFIRLVVGGLLKTTSSASSGPNGR